MTRPAKQSIDQFRKEVLRYMVERGSFPSRREITAILGGGSPQLVSARLARICREIGTVAQAAMLPAAGARQGDPEHHQTDPVAAGVDGLPLPATTERMLE